MIVQASGAHPALAWVPLLAPLTRRVGTRSASSMRCSACRAEGGGRRGCRYLWLRGLNRGFCRLRFSDGRWLPRFGGDLSQGGRCCLRPLSPQIRGAVFLSLALTTRGHLGFSGACHDHAERFCLSNCAHLLVGRLGLLVVVQLFRMMQSALGLVPHEQRACGPACLLPRRLDLLDLGFAVRSRRRVDVAVAN